MPDLAFDYPDVLTKKSWDKNKGVIAKVAVGKTDVGAALAALQAEFQTLGFGSVKPFGGTDPLDYLQFEEAVVSILSKGVSKITAKIKLADDAATKARDEFKRAKAVSTKHVQKVVDGLRDFQGDVNAFPAKVKAEVRNDYRDRLHKMSAYTGLIGSADNAEKTFANLNKLIKKVEADPTISTLHDTFGGDGPHRQMTTVCKLWDQLVAGNFPKLAKKIYAGTAMNDYFRLPGMADVANETNGTASQPLQALVNGGQDEERVVTKFLLQYSSSVIKAHEILNHLKAASKVVKAI